MKTKTIKQTRTMTQFTLAMAILTIPGISLTFPYTNHTDKSTQNQPNMGQNKINRQEKEQELSPNPTQSNATQRKVNWKQTTLENTAAIDTQLSEFAIQTQMNDQSTTLDSAVDFIENKNSPNENSAEAKSLNLNSIYQVESHLIIKSEINMTQIPKKIEN